MQVVAISKFLQANFKTETLSLEYKRQSPALDLMPTKPSTYVEPTISLASGGATPDAPILLISAAGAMGKTVTSKAIAEQLGCPKLDLAHVTVGQDSHSGVLNRVLTGKSLGSFMEKLDRGATSLVIDALDEAPLRSGERAFFAFMESLAEDAASFGVPNHQFIVLGRPQTIELFAELCKDYQVATTNVTLDSLSLESSLDLIANELKKKHGSALHEVHTQPAREYWTSYLLDLASVLTGKDDFAPMDWKEVSDFLGYPPVVCAIAPTLQEANYSKSAQLLKRTSSEIGTRSTVLTKIIGDLLARETAKVQQQLSEVFRGELTEFAIRALYGYEEQLGRILGSLGIESPEPLPASLPDEYRARYEEAIETFVVDHPFLDGQSKPRPRNVVFSDHLRSIVNSRTAFISGSTGRPLQSDSLLPVGPFYIHFMTEFCTKIVAPGSDNYLVPAIQDEDYVYDLIASWISGTPSDWTASYHYLHPEGTKPIVDFLMERAPRDDAGGSSNTRTTAALFFTIEKPHGLLQIKSPISNVSIASQHGVYIASADGSITIGPNATIVAKNLQTSELDEVIFRGTTSTNPMRDQATLVVSQDLKIPGEYKIKNTGRAMTTVLAPFLDPRWNAYKPEVSPIDGLDRSKVTEAIMYIRRILTSFRSTNGNPSIHADKFARHIVGRNELLRTVASAMQEAGLIELRNGMMTLNQTRLSELEISYDTYSSPDWIKKFTGVMALCLNSDRNLVAALKAKS